MMSDRLSIHAILPELLAALRANNSAVLIAPPGAGKTTAVAPALLSENWCDGHIILLSPRRVAARAAAERIAAMLGEEVGDRVGYRTRLDSKTSARTRIFVVTEAIFVSQILTDEEISGVSCVLFDEAHERHLDSDLGLALALETQSILREDLRVVIMSATIEGERFAQLLGPGTPMLESEGRQFPLAIEWLASEPDRRIEDRVASAVLRAWREHSGDILVFLPGVGEISRVRDQLIERLPETPILPLHGQITPEQQRAAIRHDPRQRRRIVLATSIAETSVTLEGVSIVVDSGLSRRAEFDAGSGVTRLVTRRASRASSAQRAGRAARTGPGIAYRLWEQAAHAGREAYDPPEILSSDLAPLILSLARWNIDDPSTLRWLDPPPPAALAAGRERLRSLAALDESGRITERGRKIAALPIAPWQAAMILFGVEYGAPDDAARLALLLQERGLGGRSEDLSVRLSAWAEDRGGRAAASRRLAVGWAARAQSLGSKTDQAVEGSSVPPSAVLLAAALPDNIARRRDATGAHWLSAGGKGYVLDPASPLARSEWMVIGDAQGAAKAARITAALTLDEGDIERWLPSRIQQLSTLRWTGERVEARVARRLGVINLSTGPDQDPDTQAMLDLLVEVAVDRLGKLLPVDLLPRASFAGLGGLTIERLAAEADFWLRPLLEGRRDLDLPRSRYGEAALVMLSWEERARLDQLAPRNFETPAGTSHAIDYLSDGAPSVEVRLQALFGLDRHPMVGETRLLLKLTNPAGRPVQTTRDLPGFWRGSWAEVAKDMRGRYPKHRWPDEPWTQMPSLKTKRAFTQSSRST